MQKVRGTARFHRRITGLLLAVVLAGCATPDASDTRHASGADNPWNAVPPGAEHWQHLPLPGKKPTVFSYTRMDGRDAMAAIANASASMLRRKVSVAPQDLGGIRFSWKVPALMPAADMAVRETDDAVVRVVLAFDGDRSQLSARNAMLSELARALTGEEMPYATLMYVWSRNHPEGTVIQNPRTDRIRKLVIQSGPAKLGDWLSYQRNIQADYRAAFGEAPGTLIGIGIMTDSDNTGSLARAWYGPVSLVSAPAP